MHLRSGNQYRSGGQGPPSVSSWKSSEESVANSFTRLDPILKESECLSTSSSNVSTDMYNDKAETLGSPYTICLAYVWGAQIYKDPANQWLVKIETHATTFDATPRVAFQGNGIYVAQNGSSFMVVDDPEQVDKFGTRLRENQP